MGLFGSRRRQRLRLNAGTIVDLDDPPPTPVNSSCDSLQSPDGAHDFDDHSGGAIRCKSCGAPPLGTCQECGAPVFGGHTGYCSKSAMRSGELPPVVVLPDDCEVEMT